MTIEDCFNTSDAMISDVSAVVSDYLQIRQALRHRVRRHDPGAAAGRRARGEGGVRAGRGPDQPRRRLRRPAGHRPAGRGTRATPRSTTSATSPSRTPRASWALPGRSSTGSTRPRRGREGPLRRRDVFYSPRRDPRRTPGRAAAGTDGDPTPARRSTEPQRSGDRLGRGRAPGGRRRRRRQLSAGRRPGSVPRRSHPRHHRVDGRGDSRRRAAPLRRRDLHPRADRGGQGADREVRRRRRQPLPDGRAARRRGRLRVGRAGPLGAGRTPPLEPVRTVRRQAARPS